jgi:hypothetical protein
MTVIYHEIRGTLRMLAALARKHDVKYVKGDKLFRRTEDGVTTIKAFRVLRPGSNIHVQRVRAAKGKGLTKCRRSPRSKSGSSVA